MSIEGLRALVWSVNRAVLGVEATVVLEGEAPIATLGVWVMPETQSFPALAEGLARREMVRILALGRDEVPRCPRGTLVTAVGPDGGDPVAWVVDGLDRIEPDHWRVVVVPAPEPES